MTTQTYSSPIDHTTDAGFRAWATALDNAIVNAGLVRVPYTGEPDLSTATKPPTNTRLRKVYRFNDTHQSVSPVFISIGYGTGTGGNFPATDVTIGNGADSNGSITGTILPTRLSSIQNGSPLSSPLQTNVCVVDGCVGIAWGLRGANSVWGYLLVGRSVDAGGNPTPEGLFVHVMGGNAGAPVSSYSYTFQTSTMRNMDNGSSCLVAGGMTSSTTGDGYQAFKHYGAFSRVRPIPWIQTVLHAEAGNNTQFRLTPIGGKERNYISLGGDGFRGRFVALPDKTEYTIAMVWE